MLCPFCHTGVGSAMVCGPFGVAVGRGPGVPWPRFLCILSTMGHAVMRAVGAVRNCRFVHVGKKREYFLPNKN